MNMILLGPPGVGKGTEADLLSKRLNLDHISTGDMLRQEVRGDTALGKKAKAFMNEGKLVPDDLIMDMVKKRLKGKITKRGFVLDGIPRTLCQAEALEKILLEMNASLDFAINLQAKEGIIIERLSGRRVCRKCDALYHIKNMKPKRQDICDRCGGELYQRDDDKVSTIKERLRVYEDETHPLIEFYKGKGLLLTINADGDVEETYDKISKNVKRKTQN
jgi:adenylate kinase